MTKNTNVWDKKILKLLHTYRYNKKTGIFEYFLLLRALNVVLNKCYRILIHGIHLISSKRKSKEIMISDNENFKLLRTYRNNKKQQINYNIIVPTSITCINNKVI